MKVLITDLTRMRDGHVCVAGIDVDKDRRVRPVAASALSARLLASRGGPLDLRSVIDIGRTSPRQSRPEVEDVRFDPASIRPVETSSGPDFIARLRRLAVDDFSPIGKDLRQQGTNLVVPKGKGRCSLLIVRTTDPVRVRINAGGRLRLQWQDDLDLPITDVRLFSDDMRTPVPERVRWAQEQLAVGGEVLLCFGLGRPYEELHWLQLNNFHMSASPEWQLQ